MATRGRATTFETKKTKTKINLMDEVYCCMNR
jgi:hypothetical protein